ncbi:MAG: hypothetical protein ABL974_19450 [Prosthecobacter sp.]
MERLFEEPRRSHIASRLVEEVSENIPFCDKHKSEDMDRIRFSVMKLLTEPGQEEDSVFELAKIDWRDLFMAAGFGYTATEHLKWYESMFPNEAGGRTAWWAFWRRS